MTTREIPITVPAEFDDAQSVARDRADLALAGLDDVRGNITLPSAGEFGSAITWAASPNAITPTGEVTRPAYGRPDVPVTLTATLAKGGVTETKTFAATVKAMPRARGPRSATSSATSRARALADGEQLRFATLDRQRRARLGRPRRRPPSLVSQLGDQGLRDPFIIRSPDGDTFYMIATDLNWFNRNRDYQINDTPVHRGLRVPRPRQLVPATARQGGAGQRRQRVRARGLLGRFDRRLRRLLGAGDVA